MAQDVHCIIGASGQLGTEMALSLKAAGERVVLMDIKSPSHDGILDLPFEQTDVCDLKDWPTVSASTTFPTSTTLRLR